MGRKQRLLQQEELPDIKLLLTRIGEQIVSFVQPYPIHVQDSVTGKVEVDDGYLMLIQPMKIMERLVSLEDGGKMRSYMMPWMYYSADDRMVVSKDFLATVVEPREEVILAYKQKISKQIEIVIPFDPDKQTEEEAMSDIALTLAADESHEQ